MEVAAAVRSPSDVNVVEGKIRARPFTTKDIIILCLGFRRALYILHGDVLDDDSVSWLAGWPAVEVILLDVDAIF